MPRNLNEPIPGFEDEFVGTVGNEKRIHKTHFDAPGIKLKKSNFNSLFEWVEVRAGRWQLVKRSQSEETPDGGAIARR